MVRSILTCCFSWICFVAPCLGFNEEEATEQWGSAYVWFQTGRNLTMSGQRPLALGSFLEALKQFKKVANDYPGYETKMVSYRIEALTEDIEKLRNELSAEDLAIADDYVAYIKLIEQADEERYSAMREEALATLHRAKAELDSLVARRPDAFGPALKDQDRLLQGNIDWLGKLTEKRRSFPSVKQIVQTGYRVKGTTEFITEADLPDEPGTVATATLFP
ncbi:MAG: hypothetical protein P1U89_04085 [Verrucomicrobiales bacterium]|nr:hypothetical protein [Verrucomicrobiales bacterium]